MGSLSIRMQEVGGLPISGNAQSRSTRRSSSLGTYLIFLIMVVVLAHAGLLYYGLQQKDAEQRLLAERRGDQEAKTLSYLLTSEARTLEGFVAGLAQDPGLVAAMAADDRTAASARVGSPDAIRSALPLQELNFHMLTRPYWLKIDSGKQAESAGKALHPAVSDTLASGKPRQGFSTGPGPVGLHVTMPVVHGGRVIGAVEAVADHRALIQKFIEQSGTDAALYILLPKRDRSDVLHKLTQLGIDTQAVEEQSRADVYVLDAASDIDFFEKAAASNELAEWQSEDTVPGTIVVDEKLFPCRSLSVKDHDGQGAGFILWTHGEQPAVAAAIDETHVSALALSAALILGCTLVTFVASRRRTSPPALTPVNSGADRDRRCQALFDQSTESLIIFDASGAVDVNRAALKLLGYHDRRDVIGSSLVELSPEFQPNGESSVLAYRDIQQCLQKDGSVCIEWTFRHVSGSEIRLEAGLTRFTLDQKELTLISLDEPAERDDEQQAYDLSQECETAECVAIPDLSVAREQLAQAEKLASVGRLASGIAHEINTPIQYVGDNFHALSDSFKALKGLLDKYRGLTRRVKQGIAGEEAADQIQTLEKELDLDYLLNDIPQAITEGLEGVHRVASILRAMKDFTHVDSSEWSQVNINQLVESATIVTRNAYKYVADVHLELGEIAPVECNAGEMGQAVLNLLMNAVNAVAETGERGRITIGTRQDCNVVEISITDTGPGIPADLHDTIFDPYANLGDTDNRVGHGLFIARRIIMERHEGELRFESTQGAGTTFFIRLPTTTQARAGTKAQPAQALHQPAHA